MYKSHLLTVKTVVFIHPLARHQFVCSVKQLKNYIFRFDCKYVFNPVTSRPTGRSNSGPFVWLNTGKDIISRGEQTPQINDISVIHIWFPWTTGLTITLFPREL